jgi:hypothetical protein
MQMYWQLLHLMSEAARSNKPLLRMPTIYRGHSYFRELIGMNAGCHWKPKVVRELRHDFNNDFAYKPR